MVEYPWRPLGELLVERGALDQYELDHWLKQQRLSGMLLGELLVLHRVVSPMDVAAALAVQRGAENVASGIENGRNKQLGRILVERDLLTESGLQRVLLEQQRTGVTLGEVLVRRGYVSQEQIDELLAEQRGVRSVRRGVAGRNAAGAGRRRVRGPRSRERRRRASRLRVVPRRQRFRL